MRVDGEDEELEDKGPLRPPQVSAYELGSSSRSLAIPQSPVTVSRKKPSESKIVSRNIQERSRKFYVKSFSEDERLGYGGDEGDGDGADEEDDLLDELEQKLMSHQPPSSPTAASANDLPVPASKWSAAIDRSSVQLRTVPPPLPLLSPVYTRKNIVALDYHRKPKVVSSSCVTPTASSLGAELKGIRTPQLHPIDCLARSFQRAEEEAMAKFGYNNNSDQAIDGADKKSFRNKKIPVYSCQDKNSSMSLGDRSSSSATVVPQDSLQFDSKFESGNLATAARLPRSFSDPRNNRQNSFHQEYELLCRNDLHTRGNTQWFFFSVTGKFRKGMCVRFNITNMRKADSIVNYGMRPAIYSEGNHAANGKLWTQGGSDVCYFKGSTQYNDKKGKRRFHYTLSFTYEFQHANDKVFFAYNYPYTYTMLQEHLQSIECDSSKRNFFRRVNLCKTISGNSCDLLTITGKTASMAAMNKRQVIVISARVHPGETVGSWMMHGLIDFLTGDSTEAKVLREHFIFKLIPMLNPDGVINGNYRCNLAGVDLNRRWSKPSSVWHPTIFSLKDMISKLQSTRGVIMYCDLHGHSRKKNIFMYACCPTSTHKSLLPKGVIQPSKSDRENYIGARRDARLFAYIMAHVKGGGGTDISLNFADSTFNVRKSKKSTARVVVWHELRVPQSFTVEASFCGNGNNKFDSKCKSKYKKAFKDGVVHISQNGKFSVSASTADDEAGDTTQNESSRRKTAASPKSPGVQQMYSQEYDYTHYTSADLCGFGRVVAKSLVVYYDLADEVDRVRDAMTETDEDFKWRSNLVGMRSRIVQDLETKLSRQYDFRNKQRRGGEEAFGTRRAEKTRNEHFSKEMDSDADAGLGDDIPFDLPDSDVDSVGSDSEPSADNMDESELLELASFNKILTRVDKKKAKSFKKRAAARKKEEKKLSIKQKKAVSKKKSSSSSKSNPKRSLARAYAQAAKGYEKTAPKKREAATILWKESVSLNLFDKAMVNDKIRSTEKQFWLVNTKSDINAVLSKMSMESKLPSNEKYGSQEDNLGPLLQSEPKKKGYGSDRIHRASRESLASAPASLYDGKNLAKAKKQVMRRERERAKKKKQQTELKKRARKTLAKKPAESGSEGTSDGSSDNLIPPPPSQGGTELNKTNRTSLNIESSSARSVSKAKRASKHAHQQNAPISYGHSAADKEKTVMVAHNAMTQIGTDIQFQKLPSYSHSYAKRAFNKPRKPPPHFRNQSRNSVQNAPGGLSSRNAKVYQSQSNKRFFGSATAGRRGNSESTGSTIVRRSSIPMYPQGPNAMGRVTAPQVYRPAAGTNRGNIGNFSSTISRNGGAM
jgi:hypothetical protein